MTATLNEIDSNEKLVELFERSENSPVLLFKHSTNCPISSHVLSDVRELSAEINVIVVQHARGVSNEVETRLGVRHESPQAIVVSHGRAVYQASHYDVSSDEIAAILASEAVN